MLELSVPVVVPLTLVGLAEVVPAKVLVRPFAMFGWPGWRFADCRKSPQRDGLVYVAREADQAGPIVESSVIPLEELVAYLSSNRGIDPYYIALTG